MRCYYAKWKQHQQDAVYRRYTAKCAQLMVRAFAGVDIIDYEDLLGEETMRQDTRNGEEIAADVIKNAGLEVAMDGFI